MIPSWTRFTALATAITLTAAPLRADTLNQQAKQMFDDLGVVGNITTPQAFRGQTLNTYTGGSLFVRAPTRTYQLASFAPPYAKGNCGGIDIFGGSFSHISSAEFKNMLKNITSALPGVIFNLLLASVEPLFESEIKWFKDTETFINKHNINSCEQARELVATAAGKVGFSTTKACEGIASRLGIASDGDDARNRCRSTPDVNSVLTAGAANPDTANLVPFTGNLVWATMRRWNHLEDDDRELIMSLTGTTIYPRATDGNPEAQYWPPTIRSVADLLYGNTDSGGSVALGDVKVKLLKCADYPDCSAVSEVSTVMPSLASRVITIMRGLSTKIANGSGTPTTAEQNFVNSVPLPVYRLLAASNSVNNPNVAEAKINQYAEYVAVEFANALLARAARMGTDTANIDSFLQPDQVERLASHRKNAAQLLLALASERQQAELRAQTFVAFAEDITRLERSMRANMPQQLNDLLSYAGVPGGR